MLTAEGSKQETWLLSSEEVEISASGRNTDGLNSGTY